MGNENPTSRGRMNYKIKSVQNADGGKAYSILACADDVEARRHKRDPWGAKFVNIALSSFNQPVSLQGFKILVRSCTTCLFNQYAQS